MKFILTILSLVFLLLSCKEASVPRNNSEKLVPYYDNGRLETTVLPDKSANKEFELWYSSIYNFKEINSDSISWMLNKICDTIKYEVKGIYQIQDSIADDRYEQMVLVDSLKRMNFKVTNWARGNWEQGPRVVSIDLENNDCECEVHKLYYSTSIDRQYKVTERIRCKNKPAINKK